MRLWDVSFDRFRLDRGNERLLLDGVPVPLTPKAFAVLDLLVGRAGSLVRKETLLDAVWPEAPVGDAVLKFNVGELRRALGDDARNPRFIETVHRRGYRFVAAVGPAGAGPADVREEDPGEPGLAGRRRELELLDAALEAAREGRPSAVLVTGVAGIGKTALVELFLHRLSCSPDAVHGRGDCVPLGPHPHGQTHLPFVRALTQLCRGPSGALAQDLLWRTAPTWCDRMPWLVPPDERDRLTGEVLSAPRSRMLRELGAVVEALSAFSPVVLVLEDLHWADPSTLEAFEMLAARENGGGRLLLVGTVRPGAEGAAASSLSRLRERLDGGPGFATMDLAPLDEADVATLIERRFRGSEAAAALAAPVFRVTEGLPLFVCTVLDALLEKGAVRREGGGWVLDPGAERMALEMPESVRGMVSSRLARLGRDERALLEVAAVAGESFPAALGGTVLGADPLNAELICEGLVDAAQILLRDGVERLASGGVVGRYRFAHSLFRTVVLDSVPAGRRRRLHRLLARSLGAVSVAASGDGAAELAWHLERAGEPARAARHLVAAARHSLAEGAPREAMESAGRALALVEEEGNGAAPLGAEALTVSAMARRLLGDFPGAAEDLKAARERALGCGRADLQAVALLHLSTVLFWLDRGACIEAAVEACRCARGERTEPCGKPAATGVRLHDDARGAAAGIEAAAAIGDRHLTRLWGALAAPHAMLRGDAAAACEAAAAGVRACLDARDAFHYMMCRLDSGWALFLAGRWGEALEVATEGIETATRDESDQALFSFEMLAFWIHCRLFDRPRAALFARRLDDRQRTLPLDPFTKRVVGTVARLGTGACEGLPGDVRELTDALMTEGMAVDWLLVLPLQVELLAAAIGRGEPRLMLDAAATLERLASVAGDPVHAALAARGRAEAALVEGRPGLALREAERAAELLAGVDAPGAAWQVAQTTARVHRARQRPREESEAWSEGARLLLRLAGSLAGQEEARDRFLASPPVVRVLSEARRCAGAGSVSG